MGAVVERWHESMFRASALASDLVSAEQIDEAVRLLATPTEAAGLPLSDDALATKLVELGHLNRWQADQLQAGRTRFVLGDYQIIDCIGQGGMGQVFKAIHTLLGRIEAIKVLPRDKSTPQAVAAFKNEIRAQAQLDHPNLVRVSYAGFDRNVYYLVTEYVPGVDLRQYVRTGGRLDGPSAASIISQAAAALEYAHGRGLVHRDIKPGNLLVTPEALCKVSDLGLASFATHEAWEDPRAGKLVGTADYLAPELIANPRDVRPAADVYALGCTLYYAVTGKVPFPGGTTKEKARRHCQDTPLHPRHFNPSLDDAFVEVIADMMEKDPARRIASAGEVIVRLAPWLENVYDTVSTGRAVAGCGTGPRPQAEEPSDVLAAPEPPPLHDTDSDVLDFPALDAGRGESPSQASQGTEPAQGVVDETQWDTAPPPAVATANLVEIEAPPAEPTFEAGEELAQPIAPPSVLKRPRRPTWLTAIPRSVAAGARATARVTWRTARRAGRGLSGAVRASGRAVRRTAAAAGAWIAAIPAPLKLTIGLSTLVVAAVVALLFFALFK